MIFAVPNRIEPVRRSWPGGVLNQSHELRRGLYRYYAISGIQPRDLVEGRVQPPQSGVVLASGERGGLALRYGGSQGGAVYNGSWNVSAPTSFTMYMRLSMLATGGCVAVLGDSSNANAVYIESGSSIGRMNAYVYNTVGTSYSVLSSITATTQWLDFWMTWNGSSFATFTNGRAGGTALPSGTLRSWDRLGFGTNLTGAATSQVLMSHFAVWNGRVLTSAERFWFERDPDQLMMAPGGFETLLEGALASLGGFSGDAWHGHTTGTRRPRHRTVGI